MVMKCRSIVLACLLWSAAASLCLGQDRDTKVKNDRKQFEGDTSWVYNDIARGFEQARHTCKPKLVVFRCIP